MRAFPATILTVAAIALAGCSDGGEPEAAAAEFSVRPVLAVGVPGTATSDSAAHVLEDAGVDPTDEGADALAWLEAGDCDETAPEPTESLAVGCDANSNEVLLMGEAAITGDQVADVEYTEGDQDEIALHFDEQGDAALADLTAAAVELPAPEGRIAMVVNGDVIASPQVAAVISTGPVVMAGEDLASAAEALEAFAG